MTQSSADTQQKFSTTTVRLHWWVALLVIALLAVGLSLDIIEDTFGQTVFMRVLSLHKSIGLLAFIFILWRVIWRYKNGWPVPVSNYATWEKVLAKITHWVLILGTLIMPISGFIFSGASGHGVDFFGITIAPINPDPANPGKVIPFNPMAKHLFHEVHETVGYLLTGAVVLHIIGSLKHHFIDKDRSLLRMKGQ